jgi:hypothetical protein
MFRVEEKRERMMSGWLGYEKKEGSGDSGIR